MNEITKIYKDKQVRIVEKDNETWFVAKDVSEALGYTDAEHMTRRLEPSDLAKIKAPMTGDLKTRYGNNDILVLNEAGL